MELLQPMEPILESTIPTEKGWIHQVKWDGIRGMSYIDNNNLRVFTKRGRERTEFYPEVQQCLKLTKAKQAVLDGEIVALDDNARPSFNRVLTREKLNKPVKLEYYIRSYPVCYMIFDLLYLNGQDLRILPFSQRNALLRDNFNSNERILLTDSMEDGNGLFSVMKAHGMEGIVSKKLSSLYLGGKKHHEWLKIKINKKILAVVGGIILKENFPNSLLLGIYNDKDLICIGKAAIGLTQQNIYDLKKYITEHKTSAIQEKSPFVNISLSPGTVWLKPILTCWVQFLEWTDSGTLRQPKILGFGEQRPEEAIGKEYLV